MHELGIMSSVMDTVEKSAREAGAEKVIKVSLSVGVMTDAMVEPLLFAFEALAQGTISDGATLEVNIVEPHSICNKCGNEYDHDRFHLSCPECGSYDTRLLTGREMQIDSIEVDIPDEEEGTQD